MNEIPDKAKFARHALGAPDLWTKLMALAAMVEIDQTDGTLTLKNGKASITLRPDGRITLDAATTSAGDLQALGFCG